MIKFKYKKFRAEFEDLDRRLQHIAFDLAGVMEYESGKDIIITSVKRTDQNSTHGHKRALDFRISTAFVEHFTQEEVELMKKWCADYEYGNGKPTLFVHQNKIGKGLHGHLQINNKNWTLLTCRNSN